MKTVIIVDDEPITRMDLSDMLQDLGFDVQVDIPQISDPSTTD